MGMPMKELNICQYDWDKKLGWFTFFATLYAACLKYERELLLVYRVSFAGNGASYWHTTP